MKKLLFLMMACASFQAFAFEDEDMQGVTADVVETSENHFTATFKKEPLQGFGWDWDND